MNVDMNKQNSVKNKKIFNFPNFLNNGTILVILLAYIVLILAVIIVLVPKYDYTSVPEYSHKLVNEDVSSYLKVSAGLSVDIEGRVNQNQTITIFLNKNNLTNVSKDKDIKVNYEISALTNNDQMNYLYSGSRANYTTLSEKSVSHVLGGNHTVNGGYYKKFFGKIIYEITSSDSEEDNQVKEYKFSENVLSLTNKEKKSEIKNTESAKSLINVSLYATKSSDADYYSVSTRVNLNIESKLYHLDYQSWIMTDNGKVYPLVGFYNVCYSEKTPLSSVDSVYNNVKPKYIIVKANITNSNGYTQTYFYKEKFESIIR